MGRRDALLGGDCLQMLVWWVLPELEMKDVGNEMCKLLRLVKVDLVPAGPQLQHLQADLEYLHPQSISAGYPCTLSYYVLAAEVLVGG